MKKTALVLFMIFAMLLSTACGNNTATESSKDGGAVSTEQKSSSEDSEETTVSDETAEDSDIAYEVKQIRTQCLEYETEASITLVGTKAELDSFYEANKDKYSFENSYGLDEENTFKNLIADYDEDFFEGKDLVIIPWESNSGSNRLKLEKLYFSYEDGNKTLNVVIDEYNPNTFFDPETSRWYVTETCDMAQHFMCIAIDKSHGATGAALNVTVNGQSIATLTECEFEAKYARFIADKCVRENEINPPDYMISSVDELREYLGDKSELVDCGYELEGGKSETFAPYEIYNEEYFENKVLLLITLYEGSGSLRNKIDKVSYNGKSLEVVIENLSPVWCTDDIAYWTIFVELDKDYLVPAASVGIRGVETFSYDISTLNQAMFIGTSDSADPSKPYVQVIHTKEEYEDFVATSGYDFDASLPDITSYSSWYSQSIYEGYFDNNVVLAVITPSLPTTTRYRIKTGNYSVVKNVPSLDVVVESYEVDYGDEKTVGSWIFMLSFQRYFNDTCWSVEFTEFDEKADKEIDFNAEIVRTSYNKKKLNPHILKEKWELDNFYRINKEDFSFDSSYEIAGSSLSEVIAAYDEAFFKDKYLIVVPIKGASGSEEHSVKNVIAKTVNGFLTVEVIMKAFYPMAQTADMAQWFAFVELDREYFVKNNKFSVNTVAVYEESCDIEA